MKMRIVLELEYPDAITDHDESEVKEKLSEVMLKLAREGGFTVPRRGHSLRAPFNVSEVMVGCARIADPPPDTSEEFVSFSGKPSAA